MLELWDDDQTFRALVARNAIKSGKLISGKKACIRSIRSSNAIGICRVYLLCQWIYRARANHSKRCKAVWTVVWGIDEGRTTPVDAVSVWAHILIEVLALDWDASTDTLFTLTG